ncbi:hypothetical protein OK016_14615 [Vibrio chagasii]|nr:hypothetical protein [Vibrio chagasii]
MSVYSALTPFNWNKSSSTYSPMLFRAMEEQDDKQLAILLEIKRNG